jgi:hypothetical protein
MVWITLMLKSFTVNRLSRETELTNKMAWRLRRTTHRHSCSRPHFLDDPHAAATSKCFTKRAGRCLRIS